MKSFSVRKLPDLPFYTEGPAVSAGGDCYVTTLRGGEVMQVSENGSYSVWAKGNCPNGQVISGTGEHWICESLGGRISRYDSRGKPITDVVDARCAGVRVISPNDLILDRRGNLYFTDSIREEGKVFYLGADGVQKVVARRIDYANGLALSGNESRLYVAESYRNRILAVDLSDPGVAAGIRTFAELPVHASGAETGNLPDGLAVDGEGRVWVAHYGMQALQLLSESGELLATLDTGIPLTSNLCFLEDTPVFKRLLITGGYAEPGPGAVALMEIHF